VLAVFTRHAGVYPPATEPMPYDLIARIVAARLHHTLRRP
jgi:hypothetical protein